MKSNPRRSHSNFEGVMIFQRGDSIFGSEPPPLGIQRSSLRSFLWSRFDFLQQAVEFFLPEQAVAVYWMAMGSYLPRTLPVAQRVRRHTQVVSGIGDPQKVSQLGHQAV